MVTVTKGHQALTASLIALPLAHSSLTRQDCDCSLLQMGKRRQGGSGDFLRSQGQWAGRRAGLMPPRPPPPVLWLQCAHLPAGPWRLPGH